MRKKLSHTFLWSFFIFLPLLTCNAPTVQADQPHMEKALDSLKNARDELQQATHDKGGHRNKALALVNKAINQVQMGMVFDKTN